MTADTPALHPDMTMEALQAALPGARRALFARYHIGGCASCGFQPDETLAAVCQRNDGLSVDEVIAHLESSDRADRDMEITPQELAAALQSGAPPRLLDVRSREEFEAVQLPGAELMSQDTLQRLLGGDRQQSVVVYCHHGQRSLDAAAYLIGHGMPHVKSLAGGIDGWSVSVDPSVPRYRLEMD